MKATIEPRPAECLPKLPALFVDDLNDAIWLICEVQIQSQKIFRGVVIHHPNNSIFVGISCDFAQFNGLSRFNGSITLENDK